MANPTTRSDRWMQRVLGLGSYQTAWAMLHRYRRAMVRPGRDRLSGRVEVDEVLIGGLAQDARLQPHRPRKSSLRW